MTNPASGGSYVRQPSGKVERKAGTSSHKDGDRARSADDKRIGRPEPERRAPAAKTKPTAMADGATKPGKTED